MADRDGIELRPSDVDHEVVLSGSIVRASEGGGTKKFKLQEYTEGDGVLPKTVDCVINENLDVELGVPTLVRGTARLHTSGRHLMVQHIYVNVSEVRYVSVDECGPRKNSNASWFNNENLDDLKAGSAEMLIDVLNSHANSEGFKLVRRRSISEGRTTLMCYLHTDKRKIEGLNTDCPFRIGISLCRRGENGPFWHVTESRSLEHNHQLDSLVFAHCHLPKETKDLAEALYRHEVTVSVILDIIREQTGTSITKEQLRQVCKWRSKGDDRLESQDLIDYMEKSGGKAYILEDRNEEGDITRHAVATFSQSEMKALSEFGDMVVIDPTFTSLSSNWNLIPMTVVGRNREILSAGLVLCASVNSVVFQWILEMVCDRLPCKNAIKTLCSDDDVALESAFFHYEGQSGDIAQRVQGLKE